MADRRRRRRRASQDSEDDDDESGSGSDSGRSGSPATKSRGREPEPVEDVAGRVEPQKDAESECESEDGVGEAVLSDYDSADPEDNGSHSEGVEEEEEAEQYSDEETPAAVTQDQTPAAQVTTQGGGGGGQKEEQQEQEEEEEGGGSKDNKVEEKGNLAGERQSGDGQESTDDPETTKVSVKPGQKLDDDEDRKNPAYIPRKGLFFEHDVRGHAQEEERPKGRNRKLWKDEGRWEHDRFREEEQAPKSREELIAIYGYDIRNGGGGGGGAGERPYRHRRPRQSISPGRDKRWREAGSERPVRSWQSGGRGGTPPSSLHPSSFPATPPPSSSQRGGGGGVALRPPPPRGSNRPAHQNPTHLPPQSQYRNNESNTPQPHPRERSGGVKAAVEVSRTGRGGGGRGGSSVVIEDVAVIQGGVRDEDRGPATVTTTSSQHPPAVPRRQQQQEQRGAVTPTASDPAPVAASATTTNREASPPAERPPERKSYSLARRTRSRPADLGSKQTSMEEAAATAGNNANASPASTGGKSWTGGAGAGGAGDGPSQTGAGGAAGLADLDQDVARLSLSGQSWNQNPTSYIRSEMRGLPNPLHLPSAPPPFSGLEDLGVGSNRNKRYSSQRQRAVPEPPLHLGVMEGHYYDHMSYQGPIYAHGEGPAPIPPQGMLVQPEMHLPHPALHPHQSGGPIANPALYGGPPVSLSPGQPQQLLPPPFYPPPGVMTFQYPAMYPTPQVHSPAQAQVTYGGVTYYDTMQQQAQPKPSPPRRTSQPVTVKPPPPEVPFVSE